MSKPLGRALGLLRASELQLADALVLVAARHSRDAAVRDMAPKLAVWSREHRSALEAFAKRYGEVGTQHPLRVRSALLYGTRTGGGGLLQDLEDISLLVHQASLHWMSVDQAAKELRDDDLLAVTTRGKSENHEQHAWLETRIRELAPQALTVPPNLGAELRASIPRQPTVAAIPDPIWAPAVGALLVGLVGLFGLLAGRPWLLPSLGPTAYLQAATPAHPSARAWNTVVGHMAGLAAGFAAVAILNAWQAPTPLADHELVAVRVLAAAIAIALTLLVAEGVQASHPPAAATALLVALGSIVTANDALNLMIGAAVLGGLGEGARYLRMHPGPPKPA
jgi:HPP family